MSRKRFWLVLALAWTVLRFDLADRTAEAQEPTFTAYQLKGVYLYNFAKFVEWPAEAFAKPNDPFIIGVMGEDPFGSYLEDAVRNKPVGPHSFAVRHVRLISDARKCHILFIGDSERRRLPEILNGIRGAPVLSVSDLDRFLELGGIIRFYMEGKKVRFQINNDPAKQARLKISSKLLKLGTRQSQENQ